MDVNEKDHLAETSLSIAGRKVTHSPFSQPSKFSDGESSNSVEENAEVKSASGEGLDECDALGLFTLFYYHLNRELYL